MFLKKKFIVQKSSKALISKVGTYIYVYIYRGSKYNTVITN